MALILIISILIINSNSLNELKLIIHLADSFEIILVKKNLQNIWIANAKSPEKQYLDDDALLNKYDVNIGQIKHIILFQVLSQ